MRFRFGVAALAMALAGASHGQPGLTPARRQLNIDSFEQVWRTVRDKHWDPKLNGVDWQAAHDELRPRVEQATSMEEARAAMSQLLGRLKQTHFAIVPGEAYGELDPDADKPGKSQYDGDPGIDVRVVDGHALVTMVMPQSPAEAGGVKPGWEILRLEDQPVAPALRKIRAALGPSTLLDLMQMHSLRARLDGPIDQEVAVQFLNGKNRKVTLRLARAQPRGTVIALGKMPPLAFWVESRKLPPDIGYVRFNLFLQPDAVTEALRKTVAECGDCAGFVVDLRGNPGGIGGLAMGLAGWFTNQSGLRLGTMHLRTGVVQFAVFPRPDPFRGPLAILVDGCSASTSEIFAGGMQDLKRARIFGAHTAGAALPSVFEELPNGDAFQYAIANYISEGGQPLEGIGVTPDVDVGFTRRQLLDGRDPPLDAAIRWIHTR